MARIRSARQLRNGNSHRPQAADVIRRQQTANTPGGLANQAQRAVAYRGAREINYRQETINRDERTPIQRQIERTTGVAPHGMQERTEIGYRANRMAQAVRTFAGSQPAGGTTTNS